MGLFTKEIEELNTRINGYDRNQRKQSLHERRHYLNMINTSKIIHIFS